MSDKERPLGITILAIFVYIIGILTIARGLEYIGITAFGIFQDPSWAAGYEIILGVFWALLGFAVMIVGTGLWKVQRSSWAITLGFSVVSLIITGAGLLDTWLRFVLYLILTIYLLTVQRHF